MVLLNITNIYYINLESRLDRKIHTEEQLKNVNLIGKRFPAIKNDKGSLGCALSHIECLEYAYNNNFDHVLICEDDITFLNPELFTSQLNIFLSSQDKWDVLLISGNNVGPYKNIDNTCVQITKCQTTTGYIINGHNYIKKILDCFKESLNTCYPIDLAWWPLQQQDTWFLLIPLTVVQKADYSDIEKKQVNYVNQMLTLNY